MVSWRAGFFNSQISKVNELTLGRCTCILLGDITHTRRFPWWLSGKESTCRSSRRHGFDPWVREILRRRAWQSSPLFLSGESHGQRSLEGYRPWGRKELDTTEGHGTLLYSTDFEVLEQAIRPPVEKLVRHGVKSVRQRVRNLGDYKDVHQALSSASELRKCIEKYFTDGTITLTEQDVKEIEKIEKEYHKL